MPDLPARFAAIIVAFAPLFCHRTWRHAEVLLVGAILAPGKRTVTSILRITGLSREAHFVNYHRVLSRARWSGREAARLLLCLLIHAFAPTGPIVLGLDDTIERRRGRHIKAKGIYRDPVRSSDAHFVKASGLRWISLMLLAPIPWAARVWALPFLTALAPSERYCRERGHRHKKLTDWARQLVLQVRRWLPERELILVLTWALPPWNCSQPCPVRGWSASPGFGWMLPSMSRLHRVNQGHAAVLAPKELACQPCLTC
jgi:hypothetical protein